MASSPGSMTGEFLGELTLIVVQCGHQGKALAAQALAAGAWPRLRRGGCGRESGIARRSCPGAAGKINGSAGCHSAAFAIVRAPQRGAIALAKIDGASGFSFWA